MLSQDPRVLEWLQEAALMARYHYCPDDPEQRHFLLAMLDKEDDD